MNYRVKQIQPNHADHISYYKEKYLNEMFENEKVIAQLKYDGERMLIHFDGDKVYCTSRRFSKKTGRYMENQDKLQMLQDAWKNANINIGYTVIDCECYSKDWSTIAGILHSLPERAAELSKENPPRFAVFDCLFWNGQDLRNLKYEDRLHFATEIVNVFDFECMTIIDTQPCQSIEDAKHLMNLAVECGFEGIVVKSLDRKYYDKAASLKCKKFETLDCVVCGYIPGNGKYSNTIGALEIGYYDKELDKVIKISKVNCGTDDERDMWRDNWNTLKYSVIEVKCQEVTAKSLRHPVYIRLRKDKDYKMCTKDTIFR